MAVKVVTADDLRADFLAVGEDAVLELRSDAAIWIALTRRIGREVLKLHLLAERMLDAQTMLRWGVADAIIPSGTSEEEWLAQFMAGRDEEALAAAAMLIRRRGGDPLERSEFARLFAAGVPQPHLRNFLTRAKR